MASGTLKISEPTFPNGKAWFSGDCDTLKESGYYFIGTASNIPFAWGAMVVIARSDTVVQIAHRDSPSSIYYRYWTSSNGWNDWRSDTYYGVNEQIDISQYGFVYTGVATASGSVLVDVYLPKFIPAALSVTHTLTVNWVRGNGQNLSGTISSITQNGNQLRFTISAANATQYQLYGVNLAGKITFS